MSLYSVSELYKGLPRGKYALAAFNVHNMEYTQAVIKAAEKMNAPVILMIGEPMIPFAGLKMLSTICKLAAHNTRIPVAITLDHGTKMDIIDESIKLGLSVMFDGSLLPFEKNIKIAREVVKKAHEFGVSVEGELGSIAGVEDEKEIKTSAMTNPKMAKIFIKETNVDILAVSIGNRHGLYRAKPKLDLQRLDRINKLVSVPLVLHGGSDLPEDQTRKAIELGIKKYNIGTDLKNAFAVTLKRVINQEPMPFQPPDILGAAREAVFEVACKKIRLMGSSGLASNFNLDR